MGVTLSLLGAVSLDFLSSVQTAAVEKKSTRYPQPGLSSDHTEKPISVGALFRWLRMAGATSISR